MIWQCEFGYHPCPTMDDCLLCQLSEKHPGETPFFVATSPWGDPGQQLLVFRDHIPVPSQDQFDKAIKFVQNSMTNVHLGDDVREAVGHWAARLISFKDQGKSTAKSE